MTHQDIVDCMSKCPDLLDFPTAWAIQRRTSLAHDAKCSSVAGHHPLSGPHFLCDCGAVIKERERLRLDGLTPTQRRALHPAAVVEAWEWLDTYCRHWATAGRDWQTLDNLGGSDRVKAEAHLEMLRSAGLVEPQADFKGNFVKRGL